MTRFQKPAQRRLVAPREDFGFEARDGSRTKREDGSVGCRPEERRGEPSDIGLVADDRDRGFSGVGLKSPEEGARGRTRSDLRKDVDGRVAEVSCEDLRRLAGSDQRAREDPARVHGEDPEAPGGGVQQRPPLRRQGPLRLGGSPAARFRDSVPHDVELHGRGSG